MICQELPGSEAVVLTRINDFGYESMSEIHGSDRRDYHEKKKGEGISSGIIGKAVRTEI